MKYLGLFLLAVLAAVVFLAAFFWRAFVGGVVLIHNHYQ